MERLSMKKAILFLLLALTLFSCQTPKGKKEILTPHPRFGAPFRSGQIRLSKMTPQALDFTIWMLSADRMHFYLITEPYGETEKVISQNWLNPGDLNRYNIRMKAGEGEEFKPGEKYYLYIGTETPFKNIESPDGVLWDYRYIFVLPSSGKNPIQ